MIHAARVLAIGLAAIGLAVAGLAAPGGIARPSCAQAAGAHHVAVVVEHGGGAVLTRCVAFDGDSLTGDQVMSMSGIQYATTTYGGLGKAVCQIDYEPSTYPPGCWTSTSPYWAMFVSHAGGAWGTSLRGISTQTFADGDALGWHYQPQSGPGGGPPPSPAGVCAVAVPPPPPAAPSPGSGPAVPGPGPAAITTGAPSAPTAESPSPMGTSHDGSATPGPAAGSTPTVASPARPAPAGSSRGPDAGLLAAAAGAGALGGLLVLQLLAPRIRR